VVEQHSGSVCPAWHAALRRTACRRRQQACQQPMCSSTQPRVSPFLMLPPRRYPAEQLVMVGDRYLTDVVFGNRNGMLTIRPAPFTSQGEPKAVLLVRRGSLNLSGF